MLTNGIAIAGREAYRLGEALPIVIAGYKKWCQWGCFIIVSDDWRARVIGVQLICDQPPW